ncbi:hypothetical protein L596_007868 [Steinernema carpocapsae]|uniref:Uncharacterized protein n=1 Tax=Steinernema carpocapsae TaxID=34508 RepID=A0A4U5PAS8_STECR|nr:hypothetical protein L596_007868 [Steinernema carpocapsae]
MDPRPNLCASELCGSKVPSGFFRRATVDPKSLAWIAWIKTFDPSGRFWIHRRATEESAWNLGSESSSFQVRF